MKNIKVLAMLALLAAVCGMDAAAAINKYEIGFYIPYSMPMGKFKDNTKSAVGYGGHWDLNLTDSFSLGAEYAEIQYKQKDHPDIIYGTNIPLSSDPGAFIYTYGLRVRFLKPQNFGSQKGRIYAVLGIASYRVLDMYRALDAIAVSPSLPQVEETAIGLNVGGGLDVELAPQWLAGFELRYHMINKNYSILNPTLKISYAFGPLVEPKEQSSERTQYRKRPAQSRGEDSRPVYRETPKLESVPESDDYQAHLSEAKNYISQQDYESAAQEYAKALVNLEDDDNRRVYLYERQGYMAVKAKNFARAKNYYRAAIAAAKMQEVYDKHAVNAFSGLGYCFENTGDIPLAIKNYEKALELTADDNVAGKLEANLKRLRDSEQDSAGLE